MLSRSQKHIYTLLRTFHLNSFLRKSDNFNKLFMKVLPPRDNYVSELNPFSGILATVLQLLQSKPSIGICLRASIYSELLKRISHTSENRRVLVSIATNYRALTHCMKVNYATEHERGRQHFASCKFRDNVLKYICEVYHITYRRWFTVDYLFLLIVGAGVKNQH